ncbi:hypothetical protein [Yinghuangia sp. YIM S09857]|uniref:hypothetical protein n=1 Tax=Yinghuangia sp. YIM S09857 TaxID=3436929 RepID=UPI003F533296
MAALTLTAAPLDGGLPDLAGAAVAAAGGGDTAPVGPNRFLWVLNGGGAEVTVTVATPGTVSGLDIENPALVLAAGDHGLIPLPRVLAGANGRAAITYSGVTSVTVAVIELGT